MLETVSLEIAIIIVLILANGFFAASEIAIVSARKGRLEQQAAVRRRGAAAALDLSEHPNRFLATVQVGITLIGTFAAAFGGDRLAEPIAAGLRAASPALADYASGIALGIVVVAIAYLSLILGELVPKRLALQNAEGVAAFVAPAMRRLARLATPVVWFLTVSTELVLRLLGRHNVAETPVTEEDILALVREGAAGGTVESEEHDLISSVFTFTDRTVRSLMTPRTQIVAVEIETPLPAILRTITESGYSRVPVYEAALDQIIGILYVKDLLRSWERPETIDLRALLRPPLYVLESRRALDAFQQLQQHHSALAIVLDEYGQVAGLVTLEDMLEELVGDLADEYDEAAEAIARRDDGSYLVDGLLPIADFQKRLRIPGVDELARARGFETVAGLLLALLGRIPIAGETASWPGYRFEVVDMDGMRVDKVLITQLHLDNDQQTEAALASGALLPPPDSVGKGDRKERTAGE